MSKKLHNMYTNQVLFGKYAGNSIKNLLENDPEYLLFLAKEKHITLSPSDRDLLVNKLGFTSYKETTTFYDLGDVPF